MDIQPAVSVSCCFASWRHPARHILCQLYTRHELWQTELLENAVTGVQTKVFRAWVPRLQYADVKKDGEYMHDIPF